MKNLLLLLCSIPAWAVTYHINLIPDTAINGTVPNSAPWNAMGNFTFAQRIYGFTDNSVANGGGRLWQWPTGLGWGRSSSSGRKIRLSGESGSVSTVDVPTTCPNNDVIVGFWRDKTAGRMQAFGRCTDGSGSPFVVEGTATTSNVNLDFSGAKTFTQFITDVKFGWVRFYSDVKSAYPPSEDVDTNLLKAWEFENALTPAGGTAPDFTLGTLTQNGATITYTADPTYAPVSYFVFPAEPAWNQAEPTIRAGVQNTIDGSMSYPLDGGSTLTYQWQHISGPAEVRFTFPQAASTPMVAAEFGEYQVRLTVCDGSGGCSSRTLTFGAVATDSRNSVIPPNANIAKIIGPMVRFGANQWGYADERMRRLAEFNGVRQGISGSMGTYYSKDVQGYYDQWLHALPGRVHMTNNSTAVGGIEGTTFQSSFCNGGTTWYNNSRLVVWYPTGVTGETRHITLNLTGCTSNTAITTASSWTLSTGDYYYAKLDDTHTGFWEGTSYNVNYYDNVLGFYTLYYRTGYTKYRDWARWLADTWMSYPDIDLGYAGLNPPMLWFRHLALTGLIVRAFDGKPEVLDQLDRLWAVMVTRINADTDGAGERETGYILNYLGQCALYSTTQSSACRSAAKNWVLVDWAAIQHTDGSFRINFASGESWGPGTGSGTTACAVNGNDTITLSNTPSVAPSSDKYTLFWTRPAGTPNGGPSLGPIDNSAVIGGVYKTKATGAVTDATHFRLATNFSGPSPACDGPAGCCGLGWHVAGSFFPGWGTQPFMMGIVGKGFWWLEEALKANNPADADIATVHTMRVNLNNWIRDVGWWSANRGLYYFRGFPHCENPNPESAGFPCSHVGEERGVIAEAFASTNELFNDSGQTSDRDWMDIAYGAFFGYPGWDYVAGTVIDSSPGVPTDPNIDPTHYGKEFGFFAGMGRGAGWPIMRQGGPVPDNVTNIPITLTLGSAADVRVTVYDPDGSSTQTVCSSFPCDISVNRTKGRRSMMLEYRNGSGVVLSRSERQAFGVE